MASVAAAMVRAGHCQRWGLLEIDVLQLIMPGYKASRCIMRISMAWPQKHRHKIIPGHPCFCCRQSRHRAQWWLRGAREAGARAKTALLRAVASQACLPRLCKHHRRRRSEVACQAFNFVNLCVPLGDATVCGLCPLELPNHRPSVPSILGTIGRPRVRLHAPQPPPYRCSV